MLVCQKHLFSLDERFHYINCATMSPNLKAVEQAGIEGIMRKSKPHLLTQETFFETTKPVKQLFAQLINCDDEERIALIPSTSYGMAIVAENLRYKANLRAGQEIILVEGEFPSDVYAWEQVCKEKTLQITTIAAPKTIENRGKVWNESLIDAISANTCMVVISPTHWADGTRFDLLNIAEKCRAVGAWFIIDGTQSLGAVSFDVQAIRPDALINVGYKWLLGPYSSGVAYFGEAFDVGIPIERNWINRVGSEDFRTLVNYQDQYRPKADRFNVGERSNFILNPMLAASLKQILDWGVDNIQNYCKSLIEKPLEKLQEQGFWIEEEGYRNNHLVGILPPKNTDISTIQQALKDRNVQVSFRGDFIRISPHVYNTTEDIDLLVEGLLV